MLAFSEETLEHELAQLRDDKTRLAWLLLLSERQVSVLETFTNETGFDTTLCKECLVRGWELLDGDHDLQRSDFLSLAEKTMESAPDTEDVTHPLTSSALSAYIVMSSVAAFGGDHRLEHVVEAAVATIDSISMFLELQEGSPPVPIDAKGLLEHPLMQQELKRQHDDYQFVKSISSYTDPHELTNRVRERSLQSAGILNLVT